MIAGAQDVGQASGDSHNQTVADIMAESVVGLLEMIEVQIKQRELVTPALAAGDFRIDQGIEEKTIGQTGQCITTGHLPRGGFAAPEPVKNVIGQPGPSPAEP